MRERKRWTTIFAWQGRAPCSTCASAGTGTGRGPRQGHTTPTPAPTATSTEGATPTGTEGLTPRPTRRTRTPSADPTVPLRAMAPGGGPTLRALRLTTLLHPEYNSLRSTTRAQGTSPPRCLRATPCSLVTRLLAPNPRGTLRPCPRPRCPRSSRATPTSTTLTPAGPCRPRDTQQTRCERSGFLEEVVVVVRCAAGEARRAPSSPAAAEREIAACCNQDISDVKGVPPSSTSRSPLFLSARGRPCRGRPTGPPGIAPHLPRASLELSVGSRPGDRVGPNGDERARVR